MVGLIGIVNNALVEEIKQKNPAGIYSLEDFISKVLPGEKFYTVRSGEYVGATWSGPHTLVSVYDDEDNKKRCQLKGDRNKWSDPYLADYFWSPKACFLNERDIKAYISALNSNKRKIWGTI